MDKTTNGATANSATTDRIRVTPEERRQKEREAWLAGPTEDEKEAWARTEQAHRTASTGTRPDSSQADYAELERLARRYSREAQLAIEGALYWALRWPFELMATLVQAGRKWEEDYSRTMRRRRVSLYDDDK